jgi:outer membrane protein assembly factor BamB
MKNIPSCLFVFCVQWHFAAFSSSAQEWTRFRGPNGTGVSNATVAPIRWTGEDYNWKAKLPGVGHSSPVIWGDRIFVTCGDPATGARMLLCFQTATGRQLWLYEFDARAYRMHKLNSFASATPAVDRDLIYLAAGDAEQTVVTAVDHNGKEVWSTAFEPFKSGHGFGASVMLYGDLVVMPNDHQGDSQWIALDRQTGAVRWQVKRDSSLHYSTPCVFRLPQRADELIFTNWEYGICGVDPANGKILWNADVFDKGHIESSIGSPVVAGDLVIGVCGWLGYGNEVIAVRPPKALNDAKPEVVWRITSGAPLCTTPLVKDDLIFLWSDSGVVTCADVLTAKIHWRKRAGGTFYSSPICVGDYVYNCSTDGEMVVLRASSEYTLAARNDLGEPSHATPAVAGGVMYVRTFSHLLSIGAETQRP